MVGPKLAMYKFATVVLLTVTRKNYNSAFMTKISLRKDHYPLSKVEQDRRIVNNYV